MIISSDEYVDAVAELKRRNEHVINTYKPMPNQKLFHESSARYRLLFGGNQSGKSHAAAYEIACWARGKHPYRSTPKGDIEIWVISSEYVTIKTGIYRHLRNIIPDWDIDKEGPNIPGHSIPSYIRVKRSSGIATITFMSAKGENREKFQAAAVNLISIDEEIQGDLWEELEARTLATAGQFIISATLVESYDWIVGLEQQAESGDKNVFLTRLNTEHNHYLDPETVSYLKKKWSHETLEYRFYGKSRRTTGLVYKFDRSCICKPFKIPADWPKWVAFDPGIRTAAVLWITVDPNDNIFGYRELYLHNEPLHQVIQAMRISEGYTLDKKLSHDFGHFVWEPTEHAERMINRVIDDKYNSRLITGEQGVLGQAQTRYGTLFTPAIKDMRPGIETIRFWLDEGKFKVFNTLDMFWEEVRRYRLKSPRSRRPEPPDEPVRRDNHLMDCWRYLAMENPKYKDRRNYGDELKVKESVAEMIKRKKEKELVNEYLGTCW